MRNEKNKKEKLSLKAIFSKIKVRKPSKPRHGDTPDMEFQWKAALSVLVLTAILSLTFGLILFQHVGGRAAIGFTSDGAAGVENIDRNALQEIIQHYEEKRRENARFQEGSLSVPSPSEDLSLSTPTADESVLEPSDATLSPEDSEGI